MAWLMNPRLLTPAIVLISFGAALGLTGPHAGPAHAAVAAVAPPPPATLPTQAVTAAPLVMPQAEPAPGGDTPVVVVTPEDQAQEREGFLDARDRAAERGARSH